jgi:rhamnulokinase
MPHSNSGDCSLPLGRSATEPVFRGDTTNTTANFLAIDLGAASGRVVLGRWDGARFELQELHRFANGPVAILDHQHWDVLRIWEEIQAGVIRYASESSAPVAGIGVDAWGVDFALLDKNGRLLGNPYHYRDVRTDGIPDIAHQSVPFSQMFETTGIQFMQINTIYQLYSMVHTHEPQLDAAALMLMMPDLFNYWMTGLRVCEYTDASTSQMLDSRTRTWATGLLSALGIPTAILPPIMKPGAVLGKLRAQVASDVGLQRMVPVIAVGSHDTASAVAAIPGLDQDSLYISSGTWSLMGVEIPEPVINEQALALNVTNEGGVANRIRLLKNIAGLWLLQESRRQWQKDGHDFAWDDLLAQAAAAEPFRSLVDPDARDFLNPGDMPAAIRAFCQRTEQPQPETVGQVVRCCLESLALRYRWVLEGLQKLTGRRFRQVLIVGGGSQNRLLCQFAADACELPVLAGPVEATALGNIMMQAVATGHLSDITTGRQAVAASFPRQTFEPQCSDGWRAAYARFCKLAA